jgi:hypothetical protein
MRREIAGTPPWTRAYRTIDRESLNLRACPITHDFESAVRGIPDKLNVPSTAVFAPRAAKTSTDEVPLPSQ